MSYVRSHTLTDILCPRCGGKGSLMLMVLRRNKIVKLLYVRHSDGRRVYYHYLLDVYVDDDREVMLHNDKIKCILQVAVASGARKLELDDKIVIHHNRFTITLDSTLKVEYATELSKNIALAVVDEIKKCMGER